MDTRCGDRYSARLLLVKYLVIALLALVLGGLAGRMIWGGKPPPPVDPVQVILTQVRTHAVIEHERQIAIWYRACPQVIGKTPQIFMAWPARLVYELELRDVQVKKTGTVIEVSTSAIHSDEPSVPTDFMDYLSTTSIFTFANEQDLVNHEIGKASPIARYLTTYFMARDPAVADDFARVDVEIPKVVVPMATWPKLPKLELCEGSYAAVNGLPFAKTDGNYTVPIGFRPPSSQHSARQKAAQAGATSGDAPKGTATIIPTPRSPVPRATGARTGS
jgi:hypothetical protein